RFKKRNFKIRKGGKRRNEIGMKAQLVQDQLFTSPVLAYRANRSDFVDGGSRRPRVRRGLGSVPRLLTWGGSEVPAPSLAPGVNHEHLASSPWRRRSRCGWRPGECQS